MSVRYDLTAVEILKLLGYTEPVGKDALLQADKFARRIRDEKQKL